MKHKRLRFLLTVFLLLSVMLFGACEEEETWEDDGYTVEDGDSEDENSDKDKELTEDLNPAKDEATPTPEKKEENCTHQYDEGVITELAFCDQPGTKKYTCVSCGHEYEMSYTLPVYTASELYEQSVKYVGEIITYDRSGYEYALGTGIVISSDGVIVTNYHVIEGAYSAKITIGELTYTVKSVLAYDAAIDLAVLKINASGLDYANVCKKAVSVGDTVYAIGSSRGMTNTYSQGIITYANRVVENVAYVQHDASIAQGNSGGPLINAYGEVIGINTWMMADSQNLNFAIFTTELDNLVYQEPLTLAELYRQEDNAFAELVAYIQTYGTYESDGEYYRLELGEEYSSDYTSVYSRYAFYYPGDHIVTLDFLIDYGDNWVYFEIDEALDGTYYWEYFDDNCEMSGTLYAETYSEDCLLGYGYDTVGSSEEREYIRELASVMIDVLCSYISDDFAPIGVTAEDLLFYYYQ